MNYISFKYIFIGRGHIIKEQYIMTTFNINSDLACTNFYSVHSPFSVGLYILAHCHVIYFLPVKRILIPTSMHSDLTVTYFGQWEVSHHDIHHVWAEASNPIAWFGLAYAVLYCGDMHVPQRGCFYRVDVLSHWDGDEGLIIQQS